MGRNFVVANPDTDEEEENRPSGYIYHPPPLPAHDEPRQRHDQPPRTIYIPGTRAPSESSPSSSSSPVPPSTPGVPSRPGEDELLAREGFVTPYPERPEAIPIVPYPGFEPLKSSVSMRTLSSKVGIFVSSNAESFTKMDLPSGTGAASIWEQIFTTACIPDTDQQAYTICHTDFDSSVLSPPLTQDQVFDLCERCTNSKERLVFLVSLDPSRTGSGPSQLIPPPVLPSHHVTEHLRIESPIRPRMPSSHRSVSSTSGDTPDPLENHNPWHRPDTQSPSGRGRPGIPRPPGVPPPSAPPNLTPPLTLKPVRVYGPPTSPTPETPHDTEDCPPDRDRLAPGLGSRPNEPFRHHPEPDTWTVIPGPSPGTHNISPLSHRPGAGTKNTRRPLIPPPPTDPPPDRPASSDRGNAVRSPKTSRMKIGGRQVPPRWIAQSKPGSIPLAKSMNDLRSQYNTTAHTQVKPPRPAKPRPEDNNPSVKNSPSTPANFVQRYMTALSPVHSQSSSPNEGRTALPFSGSTSSYSPMPLAVPDRPQSASGDRGLHIGYRRPTQSPTNPSNDDPSSHPHSFPSIRTPIPASLDSATRDWPRVDYGFRSPPHSPNPDAATLWPHVSRSYTGPTDEDNVQATDFAYATGTSQDPSDEGTIIPNKHRPLPVPSITSTTSSSTPTLMANVSLADAFSDNDDEYYDEDDETGLWKKPLGEKARKSMSKRLSLEIPPPDRMPLTKQSSASSQFADREKAHSEFSKQLDETWAFRPPAEVVYDRLEKFFPNHDLDKEVLIDANTASGGTSPTNMEPLTPPAVGARARHKKSLRQCAAERKRIIDRASRMEPLNSVALRRRSTMLWGQKVEEMKPSHAAHPLAVPESPKGLPAPPVVFKWVRGELIGKGTYGRVYLGLNANTGEMIAVKQVEIPRTDSDRADDRQISVVEALKFESETLKDLDHPHIVQYLGFEETPEYLSIFLEYVPGGSVGGCLRKHGKFDEEVVKSFTEQILDGLEYLHANGILHRDLKADNILVDQSGQCKISDFGISKRTDDIEALGAFTNMQGSVFWMAPEVVHNQKKGYNAKIDIWSVGCVVLEMWAGRRPWSSEDVVAVMFKLGTAKSAPPVPDDVVLSPLADDFRQKCFAMNPEERPPAAILRHHSYLTLSPGWRFTGFK